MNKAIIVAAALVVLVGLAAFQHGQTTDATGNMTENVSEPAPPDSHHAADPPPWENSLGPAEYTLDNMSENAVETVEPGRGQSAKPPTRPDPPPPGPY